MKGNRKKFIKVVSDWFFSRGLACQDVADFIGCQFALESDFGNSKISVKKFNFCGMKVPKIRISVANGVSGFASYKSINMCLSDYCLYLAWFHFDQKILNDLDSFKSKLVACGYCPEPNYINKITNLLNSYKNGKECENENK